MKYNLSAIQDTLTDITKAITSVINVDATIADSDLNRITATGIYISKLGKKLSSKCVFSKSLELGKSFIIDNPRENMNCSFCDNKANCVEYAQVCCPIIVNGFSAGVIGLMAFNEEQKKLIVENEINLLDFLEKMADLISAKLVEYENTQKISNLANELNTSINSINIGIITTDINGNIIRSNKTSQKLFEINFNKQPTNICELFNEANLSNTSIVRNIRFNYKKDNKKLRGFYSIHPIKTNDETTGYIFTINELDQMIDVFGSLAGTSQGITFDHIIGESNEIKRVIESAKLFSKGSSTVLIQGESGTGKELFARAIHNNGIRQKYPFIAINCSALPENLIESELFGYEGGAFTGAKKGGNPGKFELAGKGTIFLDEIGDMPLHLQSKLLRVIQEKSFMRVGGSKSINMEARIISATNKNLEKMVEDNEFREDLYFRLNVVPIHIPPLRMRRDDILVLSKYFLNTYCKQFNKQIIDIDDSLKNYLISYNWPGNVRELENTIEYIVNVTSNSIATINNLPNRVKKNNTILEDSNNNLISNKTIIKTIDQLEKEEITKALNLYGRDNIGIEKTTLALGLSRATLYRKIKKYNI